MTFNIRKPKMFDTKEKRRYYVKRVNATRKIIKWNGGSGRIHLPALYLEELGLQPGDQVEIKIKKFVAEEGDDQGQDN